MAKDERFSTRQVFLVGFMGAGKTTVGRLLAKRLRWRFVDLDDCIRERERRDIADIFRDSGEEYFRCVESECLIELIEETKGPTLHQGDASLGMAPGERLVIALGGGAFARKENAARIQQTSAPVIFLDAEVNELRRRCAAMGTARPLFPDENQFRQLYEARRSSYMAADLRVETGGKTPEQVVEEVASRLPAAGFKFRG